MLIDYLLVSLMHFLLLLLSLNITVIFDIIIFDIIITRIM